MFDVSKQKETEEKRRIEDSLPTLGVFDLSRRRFGVRRTADRSLASSIAIKAAPYPSASSLSSCFRSFVRLNEQLDHQSTSIYGQIT